MFFDYAYWLLVDIVLDEIKIFVGGLGDLIYCQVPGAQKLFLTIYYNYPGLSKSSYLYYGNRKHCRYT